MSRGPCEYCREHRPLTIDHLITTAQKRRSIAAARERENPRYKVLACHSCNVAKGTRLRVPESHAHLIPELQALTHGVYAVWDGSVEALRVVVK